MLCVFSIVSNCLQPCGLKLTRLLCPWDFPGKNTGVGCHFLLPGIFPTQGSNPLSSPASAGKFFTTVPPGKPVCAVASFIYIYVISFILFLAVLGLYRCMGFSLDAVSRGSFLAVVRGLLTAVASLVPGHRL